MKCRVAILAGGQGTRLKSRTGNIPKPMALILGKPVLEYQIELCKSFGLTDIALLVHFENHVIKEYFSNGSKWGVSITYIEEKVARGTAGALIDALEYMSDIFFVMYADTYLNVNLDKFYEYHISKKSEISLLLHPNSHPADSDLVEIDSDLLVRKIHSYPHDDSKYYSNLVNAALYIISNESLRDILPAESKFDLAKDAFPKLIEKKCKIFGYISQEYIKDMGTPDRIDKVEQDILNGVPERLSLKSRRSAVFLDRDGTINQEVGYVTSVDKLKLIPKVSNAIKKINESGYLSILVTNQPVVARGDISFSDLENIHKKLEYELGKEGAYLDKIYYCPHHPDKGYLGEIKELKFACNCRKPNIGLINKSKNDLNIDLSSSWFIGDTTTDILTGINSGLKTILVRTGYCGYDKKFNVYPDYIFNDLNNAIEFVLFRYNSLKKSLSKIPVNGRIVLIGGAARSGKSTIAQVLSESLIESGRKAHVVSLDGWLIPITQRKRGMGVANRYNMQNIKSFLNICLTNHSEVNVEIPIYDRLNRNSSKFSNITINSEDIIIIEGVVALIDTSICSKSNVRIFVEESEEIRLERIKEDYNWRKESQERISEIISERNIDEIPIVNASKNNSNYNFTSSKLLS